MLYQLREVQRAVLTPVTDWAESMAKLYTNPYSPLSLTPFASRLSAGFELLYRLGKEYEKPEFGIKTIDIDAVRSGLIKKELAHAELVKDPRPKAAEMCASCHKSGNAADLAKSYKK